MSGPTAAISITETNVFTIVKALIDSFNFQQAPDNPPQNPAVQVIRLPANRVATPTRGFIALTPGAQKRLSTNINVYDLNNQQIDQMMPTQWTIQADFYGSLAGDWAAIVKNVWRSEYCVNFLALANSGFDLAPLYADDAMQMPLVTGEERYLERWTVPLNLQSNPVVNLPQQFQKFIGPVNLVNVDRTYKG